MTRLGVLVIFATTLAAACTAPQQRAPMTAATLARKVDDPAQDAPWARYKGRLISISAVNAAETLPVQEPAWVSTTGSIARPTVVPAPPVLGRVSRRPTVVATNGKVGADLGCRAALLRVTDTQVIVEIDGEGTYLLERPAGALPALDESLKGICAARIAADGVPYTQLLAVMDAVYRLGIVDIAVAAGGHIDELSLPGIYGSKYAAKRRRGRLDDAPVVVIGTRYLALRAPTMSKVDVMAPTATLDEPAPYQDLYEQLAAVRAAMPVETTTLVLRARRDTPGIVVARVVAAAGAAGFVDVLFTTGE